MNAGFQALLRGQGVEVRRGPRTVLAPFDIVIRAGETVAVYGPNGAGKSTLLQALAALIPASGRVWFQGQELGRDLPLLDYHRRTAAVFQEPLLLRLTVRDNVRLGLELRGKAALPQAGVDEWLQRLRIGHLADRPAATLSGGEAQRCSLARAFVLEPELLFLDEPFSALDAPTRTRLTAEVGDVIRERRVATLLVTHDIEEAAALCERCLIVDAGHVLQDGAMETVLQRPASRRVAEIIGSMNLMQGSITGNAAGVTYLAWHGHELSSRGRSWPVGSQVDFCIRQEMIRLTAAPGAHGHCLSGTVEAIRRRAAARIADVRLADGGRVQVQIAPGDDPRAGDPVHVSFGPEALWIMAPPESGGADN